MQTCSRPSADSPAGAFYLDVLTRMREGGIPFLIGGAFAFSRYASIHRETKDLDVFMRPDDVPRVLEMMREAGYRAELPFPHWLAKVHDGASFIDLIFSSGNAIARVDDVWFEHAVSDEVLGMPVGLCPPEEMIWSKAFIQERERFDGADVLHLFRALGGSLDWHRLLARFGDNWPVLFAHIVLFRYVYADAHDRIPAWVVRDLTERFIADPSRGGHTCRGTLLSREQYLWDLDRGYDDARLEPRGMMTREEVRIWTEAINEPVHP